MYKIVRARGEGGPGGIQNVFSRTDPSYEPRYRVTRTKEGTVKTTRRPETLRK